MGQATTSQENYLKTIWELTRQGLVPHGSRVASELGVSPPAVSLALRRLAREGYVAISGHGNVRLTPKGTKAAEILVRRHRLVEKLLTDVLGMPWHRVHEEAEKLEHAISPEFEKRLGALFAREKTCPHGYPLAVKNSGPAAWAKLKLLSQAKAGERVTIARVYEKDSAFLLYLDRLAILPGGRAEVVDIAYDETITLRIGQRRVLLGKAAAAKIWVRA